MLGDTTSTPDLGGLDLLPLPKVTGLSDLQLQGRICVWCGAGLTSEARDLGSRPGPRGAIIFPRGCANCCREAALRVYSLHALNCRTCAKDPSTCADRRALRRLALEGRR